MIARQRLRMAAGYVASMRRRKRLTDLRYWAWDVWAHLTHPWQHTWVVLEKEWNPLDPDDFDEYACWCCDATRPRTT